MINATIPTTTVVNSPVVNNEHADLAIPRVLFMAMDGLTDIEKYQLPFKAFGGLHMPHIPGLRATNYMLYRCRMTKLPEFTPIGDWDVMVPPEMRNTLSRSFTQTVITDKGAEQKVVSGFLEADADYIKKNKEFKTQRSDHLVFHKRLPGRDAIKAVQRTTPNGVGGVVEITALKGASDDEIAEAQVFFFPLWQEIITGAAVLPETASDLEAHIRSRIALIEQQMWDSAKKVQYRNIGTDMLRSIADFSRVGEAIIRSDEILAKAAIDGGDTFSRTSDVSDKIIAQTGKSRRNDALVNGQNATAELVKEMRLEREAKVANESKLLDLEARKVFLEEVKMGIRRPDGSLVSEPVVVTPETATVSYPQVSEPEIPIEAFIADVPKIPLIDTELICTATKKDGEPCPKKKVNGTEFCQFHQG